jgi:CDP-diacylglycerol pyrophosphatase
VSVRRRIATPLILLSATLVPLLAEASDPDALRKIVEGLCVPAETATAHPWPCKLVDLAGRYAVLKDLHGKTQYLVIATDTITGIEAPAVIASNAPNYWEDAWQARRFMDESADRPAPRNVVGLAINSEKARTQNQLHIHIDTGPACRTHLPGHADRGAGPFWSQPFPTPGRRSSCREG